MGASRKLERLRFSIGFVSAVTPLVAWNPADKDAGVTLSNINRTATVAGGSYLSARATSSHAVGKWYLEMVAGTITGDVIVGVGTGSANLGNYVGSDSLGFGYDTNGVVINNSVTIDTIASFTTGDVVMIALSMTDQKVWFGVNNVWGGGSNPVTNTGGYSIGSLTPMFPMGSPDHAVVNINPSNVLTYTPPSGFSPWTS